MQVNKWHNCYDGGWQGIIVPEAFAHPAKMSYGLLKRILAHAQKQGWLWGGDVILDPFGGIGSTGILGAYEGYQVVCVELEARFVDLAEQNFQIHYNAWHKLNCPYPVILQGDSRRLCEVVEKADCIVSSPPFQQSVGAEGGAAKRPNDYGHSGQFGKTYGQTPGQLGAMKPGKVDMVVSSPPFQGSGTDGKGEHCLKTNRNRQVIGKKGIASINKKQTEEITYGQTKGNLGNLKSGDVDCVISSPPYEGSLSGSNKATEIMLNDPKCSKAYAEGGTYPKSQGQLGQDKGDTFWSAAKIIVEQCHQTLKTGGHAIWVVKSFVRNKKIVDFPGDWQRLCEAAGFKTVCIHHAMLVKETEHKTLFGHTEVKRKERKSFFRRLAESKGSPKIDYEVVLCMVKETQ